MIYVSRNEKGESKAALIAAMKIGEHWSTRRSKPISVGVVRAVQPGRGKRAVAYGKVVSCELHRDWLKRLVEETVIMGYGECQISELYAAYLKAEARRECFESWTGLLNWFSDHEIDINSCWRIEFEKAKN